MPSAPLAVSSQSRKRLKTSHSPAKSVSFDDNKENNSIDPLLPELPPLASKTFHNLLQSEPELPPTAFPATPAAKISLADLIGNQEDAFNRPPMATTPNDHVFWQCGPRSSDPASSTRTTQKSRKRGRSSSPTSSQIEKSNHFSEQKGALNLESMQKSLRTPQNDPAVDLWVRYANGDKSKTLQQDSAKLAFTHLIPSSPQTPSTTNSKDSALRRTVSCGVEWPTAKPKKRRTDVGEPYGRTRDIFAASKKEILAPELPKMSRVSLLVEKIQESLSKKPVDQAEGPSSSSPLPDRHIDMEVSPIPQRVVPDQLAAAVQESPLHQMREDCKEDTTVRMNTSHNGSSSEFGDDDIDATFLKTVELVTGTSQQPGQHDTKPALQREIPPQCGGTTPSAPPPQRMGNQNASFAAPREKSSTSGNIQNPNPSTLAPKFEIVQESSDDEFGLDDETFASEMGDLAAQFEPQDQARNLIEQLTTTANGCPNVPAGPKQIPQVGGNNDEDAFDEDDDLWTDMANGSIVMQSTGVGPTNQNLSDNRAIKRYLIVEVVESHHETARGKRRPEKVLSVKDEKTKMLKVISLRQSWYESRCSKGSYIHLVGDFDRNGYCIVDDAANMIILHPDHLISATVVADSFTCTRRAALQDRVKATGAAEKAQVYGHILHEVFGEGLKCNDWSTKRLRKIIETTLPNYIESLYEINVQIPEAIDYLAGKMPELQTWATVFVSANPRTDAEIVDRNGALAIMAINKLLETEEHIWSPVYGLKGNIDATVQVKMRLPGEREIKTLTVPLEFKTGKKDNNESHRAQTALYTLLLSDRYDLEVTSGVLYYLETSKTFRVESVRNEIRHMIIQRNELACYVHDKLDLPPMIRKEYMCKRCYAQTSCFTYHKLVENGNGKTSGMNETFDDAVKHLTPLHQQFFRKWDDLLTKEERDSMKFRRELWTMLSIEREALGRCFSNVIVEPGSAQEGPAGSKINRYQYVLVKHRVQAGFSFTESQLTIGEPIVISDEKGHFALANGFVTNVRPTRISVAVDRRLHNIRKRGRNFNARNNQVFGGIMSVTSSGTQFDPAPTNPDEPLLLRLDKDEFSNGMATARNNIIRLMEKDLFRARELRQLIVEGVAPSFKPSSSAYTLSGPASQQSLNVDQRHAIEKVMSAKDYALVLGMPGTGKTTTIAHIIRALVSQKKSVLLTSYTHTAVDNILLKIKGDNIPILRLGAVGKVHPEVQKFADLGGIPKKTIAELENSYVNSRVVATTCLGINQAIFNARIFDYCIVDEASQITLPVCLGPIRMAKTFILVGDHYQLPPLVQNKEAQAGGLDVSLFKLLSDAQPSSVANLEHQYRMAEDIMLLSNTLIYSGRLKCGTSAVANRLLKIPNLEGGLAAHHHTPSSLASQAQTSICVSNTACWLRQALLPQNRCLFLNTDTIGAAAREAVSHGSRITNAMECTLVGHLVTTLIRSGVSPNTVGVITFYRSQLAMLRDEVKSIAGSTAAAELEMHTADKYQGRDKEVIILSCVRNNADGSIGELLKDWRRVNVAVTRAKSKLILVGSQGTLAKSHNAVLEGLVGIMGERGWVRDLPMEAVGGHVFERRQSPTQGRMGLGLRGEASKSQPQSQKSPIKGKEGGVFRKPGRIVQGMVDMERLLDKRPVLRDIVNGI